MKMPKYLFSKKFLAVSVLVVFLFSILLILTYKPFSDTIWLGFYSARSTCFTILFYVLVISFMALSKIEMYRFQLNHVLTSGRFILWALAEYVCIALVYLLLTPAATGNLLHVDLTIILRASLCVGLIIAIPYGYLSLIAENRALREEFEAYKTSSGTEEKRRGVKLYDYKGDLAITLEPDSIYYMEAQDNYVQIHYESDGSMHKYMLRCPTQKLETMLQNSSLVRCHRSYVVNLNHVQGLVRGHNRATLVLDDPDKKEISVSKSYYKQTLARLLELSSFSGNVIKRT